MSNKTDLEKPTGNKSKAIQQTHHIRLTSHPDPHGPKPIAINWYAKTAQARGPIIATTTNYEYRNSIGSHSGSYSIYRALAIAAGHLDPEHKADLTDTAPAAKLGDHFDPHQIVSFDPYGHLITHAFRSYFDKGYDIRPTIAITKAHVKLMEIEDAIEKGRLVPDGKILKETGEAVVTKAAIEPVWYLPGIAERFNVGEGDLRRILFEQTGGMYPELVTRFDLKVFLPPIGGMTVYIFGDEATISDPTKPLNVRVHDECNGSDVFGSDICTCRPYLVHGMEICIQSAQAGGAGVVVYNRKEGRALGEVTKFLVYNARKRQAGGDRADKYFERTECVAGVQDMRFQEIMPEILHWLGIKVIDRFASMSNMKYDAIVKTGITIKERVSIPIDLIPEDARVEIEAKKAAGYFSEGPTPNTDDLKKTKGRNLDE